MSSPCVPAAGVRSRSWLVGPFSAVVVLGTIAMAGGWPGRCRADADAGELSGRVVDQAGVGVPDVPIQAVGGEREHLRVVASTTTDAGGWFVLPPPPQPHEAEDTPNLKILAKARDGRLGWRFTSWPRYPPERDFRVVVRPVGEVRGRVQDQDNRPIAGAEIAPTAIYLAAENHPGKDSLQLPPELAGPLRARTAVDGSFAIRGVPVGAELHATIAGRGLGDLQVYWDTAGSATIVLDRRVGRVEGTLDPPDARGFPGKLTLGLRTERTPGPRAAGPFQVIVFRTVTADKEGRFQFADLPPGRYELNPAFGAGTPFSAEPVGRIEVGPNAVVRVRIPLLRHVTLSGRVVNARTGRGIAGVGVQSGAIDSRNTRRLIDRTETGADGRFTLGAPPGQIQVSLSPVPKTYLGLRRGQALKQEVRGDQTWPDIKLEPAVALDGVVVDAAGKPVAGASVHALPAPTGFGPGNRAATTGSDGTFHFDQLDPNDSLPLWARTNEATTDGVVVIRPGDVKGKLTLTIDPKYVFRIRGRVTGPSGQRIAGARATVWWSRDYVSGKLERPGMGVGGAFLTQTTDDSGWFVFRGLWPGDRYKVVIETPGYSQAGTPEIQGQAGETHDAGTIALTGAGSHIAGRVVGSDGKPVAGATVFNRGDAARLLIAQTDASGRFRLDSLFAGTKYAFVRREGYRFTGARVDGDADDLTITLRKPSEPSPAWTPGASPTLGDQRAFARDVLVRIWKAFGDHAERNGADACIPAMARLDLDLALQWSAERGHAYDSRARAAAAEELAGTDALGALELLGLVDGRGKQNALHTLAERFAEADPKKALMFAEEAAVQGRALPQPDRTWALAEAGEVLVRLGRAESGRKLIDEAAGYAARMGGGPMEGAARATAARALAPFDLNRALKLIERFDDPFEKSRYTAFVAHGIAARDPDRAAALVDATGSESFGAEKIRIEIAVRLGPDDPDRAVRFIEGMKRSADDKFEAEGFGWLAAAVAPRDRARAVALIDRALSLPVDRPEAFSQWMNFGGALATAAHVAASARHAGYPDMESVIMRVMATRASPDAWWAGGDPAMHITLTSRAAVLLAMVDPGSARVLLAQLEARSGIDPVKLAETDRIDWLRAWALVDLQKAAALVDAHLTALEKARGAGLRNSPIFRMIDTLILSPDRREAKVFQAEGSSWRPAFQY